MIQFVKFYRFLAKPFVSFCIGMGIKANQVTLVGFLLSFIVAYLISVDRLLYAFWVYLLMMILDHVDGQLARSLGQSSNKGAFLDSISDRFRTPILFLGIWYYSESNGIEQLLVFIACSTLMLNEIFALVARDFKEGQDRKFGIKLLCYDLLGWVNNSFLFLIALLTGYIDVYLLFLSVYGVLHLVVKSFVKFLYIRD